MKGAAGGGGDSWAHIAARQPVKTRVLSQSTPSGSLRSTGAPTTNTRPSLGADVGEGKIAQTAERTSIPLSLETTGDGVYQSACLSRSASSAPQVEIPQGRREGSSVVVSLPASSNLFVSSREQASPAVEQYCLAEHNVAADAPHLVLDTGALMRLSSLGRPPASNVCFYTSPGVLEELKRGSRHGSADSFSPFFSSTPMVLVELLLSEKKLKVDSPTPQDLRYTQCFAKRTGDFASLSATDMEVVALTYMLQRRTGYVAQLRALPKGAHVSTQSRCCSAGMLGKVGASKGSIRQANWRQRMTPPPSSHLSLYSCSSSSLASSSVGATSMLPSSCDGQRAREGATQLTGCSALVDRSGGGHPAEQNGNRNVKASAAQDSSADCSSPMKSPLESTSTKLLADTALSSDEDDGEGVWVTPENFSQLVATQDDHLPSTLWTDSSMNDSTGKNTATQTPKIPQRLFEDPFSPLHSSLPLPPPSSAPSVSHSFPSSSFSSRQTAVVAGSPQTSVNPRPVVAAGSRRIHCITTDYSMQNLLLQMGLSVATIDGFAITSVRRWGKLCVGCRAFSRETSLLFCGRCGNATLRRVAYFIRGGGLCGEDKAAEGEKLEEEREHEAPTAAVSSTRQTYPSLCTSQTSQASQTSTVDLNHSSSSLSSGEADIHKRTDAEDESGGRPSEEKQLTQVTSELEKAHFYSGGTQIAALSAGSPVFSPAPFASSPAVCGSTPATSRSSAAVTVSSPIPAYSATCASVSTSASLDPSPCPLSAVVTEGTSVPTSQHPSTGPSDSCIEVFCSFQPRRKPNLRGAIFSIPKTLTNSSRCSAVKPHAQHVLVLAPDQLFTSGRDKQLRHEQNLWKKECMRRNPFAWEQVGTAGPNVVYDEVGWSARKMMSSGKPQTSCAGRLPQCTVGYGPGSNPNSVRWQRRFNNNKTKRG